MSAANPNGQPGDSTPVVPIAVPNQNSFGHPFSQVEQRLSEIQYKMGELTSKMDHLIRAVDGAKLPEMVVKVENLTKSVDSTKTKVDELMNIKFMIIGGFAVVTVIGTLLVLMVKSAADYVVLQPKTSPAITSQTPTSPTTVEAPASLAIPAPSAAGASAQHPTTRQNKP